MPEEQLRADLRAALSGLTEAEMAKAAKLIRKFIALLGGEDRRGGDAAPRDQ